LNTLDDGADLLHYVGHGFAAKIGEDLPLGPGKSITARDIAGLRGAPAPVTVLSACLAGRGRQLRTGEQQGFATALLRAGAPAVLAAKYLLPDHIAIAFWSLLYYFAGEAPLEQAALETRRALAAKGHHPAAWSCFVLFGRPGVSIRAPHRQPASAWPSHVFRYLATGSATGLAEARALLDRDDRLTRTQRDLIDGDLVALHDGVAAHFGPDRLGEPRHLDEYAEAAIANAVIGAFGILRTADDRPREVVQNAAGTLIATEPLLCDTYLLLAAVAEIDRHLMTYVYQEGRRLLFGAARRLRWLTADDELAAVRAEIEEIAERVRDALFLDVQSIAGVDAQTFEDADAGDRGAQKRMLRNLMIRDADPRALLTPDWTPWLLRAVGAGNHQALSDALGAIDQAGRDHRITLVQRDALVRLIEQFVGPGAVDADTAATAIEAFRDTEAATALDLFLLHDAAASGETQIGLDRLHEGAETADALGATGAAAYFRGVWAQHAANDADLSEAALDKARAALAGYTSLLATDPVYLGKRAVVAVLAAELATAAGDGELAATATRTAVADVDGMLASAPAERTEELDDNLVVAAVQLLAAQGEVAAARALLDRAGDSLGDDARDRLEDLVGPPPSFPDDPDSIAEQGSQWLHDGALAAAVEWLGEARRRYQEAGRPERCCGLLGDLAVALRGLGNRAAAVRTYQEAIALCSRAGDDTNLSRWSQNLALLYAETGARDEARALLEEGRRAAERSGNSYQLSTALGNLGQFLAEEERYSEAIDYFDDAIARTDHARLNTLWRQNRAEVVRRWVHALIDANDVTRAAEVLQEAVGHTPPADEETKQTIAWTWLHLAAAESERYRPQQAAESAGQAVTLFEEIGDPESASLARQARDEVRSRVRLVAEDAVAEPAMLRQRIETAIADGDVDAELKARTDLALALLPAGSAESREALTTALTRAASAGSSRHELNLTVNAAPYLLASGDASGALAIARRARELAGSEPNLFGIVTLLHLAQVHDEGFGEQQRALDLYRQANQALAALFQADAAQAGQVVAAEEASLLRGVQLAIGLGDAAEALRMWSVWDPEKAQQFAETTQAPEPPVDEDDHELDAVLAAWRAADPAREAPAEPALPGSALTAMRELAQITGWTAAAERLNRMRIALDSQPASRGGPAAILRLAGKVGAHPAGLDEAVQLAREFAVADDDLTCLVLYGLATSRARGPVATSALLEIVARTAADNTLVARVRNLQAIFEQDRPRRLELYEAGAERLRDGSDEALRAHLLIEQASVLLELGRNEAARERAQAAIPLADEAGDATLATNARGNVAVARMNLGEYAEALPEFETLAEIQRTAGDMRGLDATLTNIAVCRMQLGDMESADFSTTTDDPVNLFNEAQRQGLLGQYDTAVDLFNRAISANRRRPDPRLTEALILSKYARTLVSAGRVPEAVERMRRAAQLAEAGGENEVYAEASDWLAQVARYL
jgi:tetratricopeptide (TPR) repeat protein